MSASLQSESKSPTSRRVLLAGALGGLGAMVASAIGRASPVRAGSDGDVVLGSSANTETTTTQISNLSNANLVLWADSTAGVAFHGSSSLDIGVWGSSYGDKGVSGTSHSFYGVFGSSDTSYGVYGVSSSSGVYGTSTSGVGVEGVSSDVVGVYGHSTSGYGVQGGSGTSIGVYGASSSGIGVEGYSTSHAGVFGRSGNGPGSIPSATGVYGYAQGSTARGVFGQTDSGHGVHGLATTGFAGYFSGKVFTTKFHEMQEITAPAAPQSFHARLFLKSDGLGHTQLCVRFHTGSIVVLATQA